MASDHEYTLEVVCPHCTRVTAISDWPASWHEPVAFTCAPKHGGCGGHALIEPPDVTGFPNLHMVIVTPATLTAAQYARATGADAPAWATLGRTVEVVCAHCGRTQLTGSVPPGPQRYIAFIFDQRPCINSRKKARKGAHYAQGRASLRRYWCGGDSGALWKGQRSLRRI